MCFIYATTVVSRCCTILCTYNIHSASAKTTAVKRQSVKNLRKTYQWPQPTKMVLFSQEPSHCSPSRTTTVYFVSKKAVQTDKQPPSRTPFCYFSDVTNTPEVYQVATPNTVPLFYFEVYTFTANVLGFVFGLYWLFTLENLTKDIKTLNGQ